MEGRRARAYLLEDAGESAIEPGFFRSREFIAAERVTHTLVIEADGGALRTPLKVNPIDSGGADAVSPYGYPGLGGDSHLRLAAGEIDFSATGLVAIFLRHRLDEVPLRDSHDRNLVFIADPKLPRKVRASDRRRAERNDDADFRTDILYGPSSPDDTRQAFLDVYTQSMERLEAKPQYFFDKEYVWRVLDCVDSRLVLTRDGEGDVAAATVVGLGDGFIHYYLTGIANSHVDKSPTKQLVRALVDWSIDAGTPLSLGGGKESDEDSLAEFKRGFANRTVRWQTSEIVCDVDAYQELSAGHEPGDYFPAYRAPKISGPVARAQSPPRTDEEHDRSQAM